MKQKETSVKDRISQFIKYIGISQRDFERKCGFSNGYICNVNKGIGADKVQSILSAFPQLNTQWLLTGEGEMLRPEINVEQHVNGRVKNISGVGDISEGVPSHLLEKALTEISELRVLLSESVHTNSELSNKLLQIIDKKL